MQSRKNSKRGYLEKRPGAVAVRYLAKRSQYCFVSVVPRSQAGGIDRGVVEAARHIERCGILEGCCRC